AIQGGLYYAPSPSIVWFWPILVALACVLAARRLRRPELAERGARGLVAAALVLAAWAAWRLVRRRHGWFTFFIVAAVAIWEGASLIAVLLDGYVLLALPPILARVAVTACLSA